jgi:hypothetical protein
VKWLTLVASLIGAVTVIGTPVWAVGRWLIKQAKDSILEDASAKCVSIAASAAASAVAPMQPRVDALDQREKRNDERWDGLDAYHDESAQKSHKPPQTKFGPAAETRGDVNLWSKKGKQ